MTVVNKPEIFKMKSDKLFWDQDDELMHSLVAKSKEGKLDLSLLLPNELKHMIKELDRRLTQYGDKVEFEHKNGLVDYVPIVEKNKGPDPRREKFAYLHTTDKETDYSRELNDEEAQYIVDNKLGTVMRGGYTFFYGHYFSQGPFPGCVRGGCHKDISHCGRGPWKRLNLRGVIEHHGFFPDVYSMGYINELTAMTEDYSFPFREAIQFITDSHFKKTDFYGVFPENIWKEWLKERDSKK